MLLLLQESILRENTNHTLSLEFLELVKVFLGVRSNLHGGPCFDHLRDQLPLSTVDTKSFNKECLHVDERTGVCVCWYMSREGQ